MSAWADATTPKFLNKLEQWRLAPPLVAERTGPDFRALSEVAGAGFEPATFGL